MKVFDGLYSFEVILLISGLVVLVVLLVAFLRRIWINQSFGGLLPFFAVPIVMIAYPSIQSISFKNDVITINKTTDALRQDPGNTALRDLLRKDVAKASQRPAASAGATTIIGRAQLALGDEDSARQSLAKAQQIDPSYPSVEELGQRIQLGESLRVLTAQVANAPTDVSGKEALQRTMQELEKGGVADPKTLGEIANAHAVLGNSQQAVSLAKSALQIDPNLLTAQEVVKKSTLSKEQLQTYHGR